MYNGAVDNYVLSQAAIPAGCYDASDSINNYDLFDQREQQSPTPDTAAELGYRGYLGGLNVSGSVVSFYNIGDYALKTGQAGGRLTLVGRATNSATSPMRSQAALTNMRLMCG